MKTFFTIAVAAAVSYAVLRSLLRQAEADLPTLSAVGDAEPAQREPLRDDELRVAQNAPF